MRRSLSSGSSKIERLILIVVPLLGILTIWCSYATGQTHRKQIAKALPGEIRCQ